MDLVPMAVPITRRVTGNSRASMIMKGMERKKLITTPRTAFNVGQGIMPSRRVTTSSTPSGRPTRYAIRLLQKVM